MSPVQMARNSLAKAIVDYAEENERRGGHRMDEFEDAIIDARRELEKACYERAALAVDDGYTGYEVQAKIRALIDNEEA